MRAIVIGGSIAGLPAARALSAFAESVSLLERDLPPHTAVPRKGVPQGRPVHGLLASGRDVLRFLFPNILEDLRADGARVANTAEDVRGFHNSAWRLRCKRGVQSCILIGPLLELHIRKRIGKFPTGMIRKARANRSAADPHRAEVPRLSHESFAILERHALAAFVRLPSASSNGRGGPLGPV